MADAPTVTIEGARLIYRNFEGRKDKFNLMGQRNVGIILTPELGAQMQADGWNVKWMEPRDEGDEATPWISVKVNFDGPRPPRVTALTNGGKHRTMLDANTVSVLDKLDLDNVDLIIRAYDYEVNDRVGRAAYLQNLYATIYEDDLDRKYANLDEPMLDDDPGEH